MRWGVDKTLCSLYLGEEMQGVLQTSCLIPLISADSDPRYRCFTDLLLSSQSLIAGHALGKPSAFSFLRHPHLAFRHEKRKMTYLYVERGYTVSQNSTMGPSTANSDVNSGDLTIPCPSHTVEAALVKKVDFKVIPMLMILYMMAFLDR